MGDDLTISCSEQIIPTNSLIPSTSVKQYTLMDKIGQGGMGAVFEAIDIQDNKKVALKCFQNIDKIALQRFKREYFLLWKIKHPNIVKALDFFSWNDSFYLVMELIKGKTLREKMLELSRSEKIAISKILVSIVKYLYDLGIYHRDIKPGNIMITDDTGELKLLDLGLGKSISLRDEGLTAPGQMIGTPEYVSPEQAAGEISDKSDLFSVALIVYQMFAGLASSPFKGGSVYETLINIACKQLPPLQKDNDLWLLLKQGLQKNPKDRISVVDFCGLFNRISWKD